MDRLRTDGAALLVFKANACDAEHEASARMIPTTNDFIVVVANRAFYGPIKVDEEIATN